MTAATSKGLIARRYSDFPDFPEITWGKSDYVRTPAAQPALDFKRIINLSLAALPQLVAKFSLSDNYLIDPTTGAWKDRTTGKTGRNVIELFAHAAKVTFRHAAARLARLIRVRPRKVVVTPAKVEAAAPVVAANQAPEPEPPADIVKREPKKSTLLPPKWFARILRMVAAAEGVLRPIINLSAVNPTPIIAIATGLAANLSEVVK